MSDRAALLVRASGIFASLSSLNSRNSVRVALAAGAACAPQSTTQADSADPPAPKATPLPSAAFVSDPSDNISTSKQPAQDVPGAHVEDLKRSPLQAFGEQVSFGGALGFATGYTIRKVGKAVLFLVGAEVVFLQYMAVREWVVVDWRRMAHDLSPKLSRSTWEGLVDVLVYKMPFSAAFSSGLVAALRLSRNP